MMDATESEKPISPEEMQQRAQVLAYNLLRLSEPDRLAVGEKVYQDNPILWALVKAELSKIQQAAHTKARKPLPADNLGWGI